MKSEDKFWRSIWWGGFVMVVALFLIVSQCSMQNTDKEQAQITARHNAIASMVINGADPKSAGCAVALASNSASAETKLFCK